MSYSTSFFIQTHTKEISSHKSFDLWSPAPSAPFTGHCDPERTVLASSEATNFEVRRSGKFDGQLQALKCVEHEHFMKLFKLGEVPNI